MDEPEIPVWKTLHCMFSSQKNKKKRPKPQSAVSLWRPSSPSCPALFLDTRHLLLWPGPTCRAKTMGSLQMNCSQASGVQSGVIKRDLFPVNVSGNLVSTQFCAKPVLPSWEKSLSQKKHLYSCHKDCGDTKYNNQFSLLFRFRRMISPLVLWLSFQSPVLSRLTAVNEIRIWTEIQLPCGRCQRISGEGLDRGR